MSGSRGGKICGRRRGTTMMALTTRSWSIAIAFCLVGFAHSAVPVTSSAKDRIHNDIDDAGTTPTAMDDVSTISKYASMGKNNDDGDTAGATGTASTSSSFGGSKALTVVSSAKVDSGDSVRRRTTGKIYSILLKEKGSKNIFNRRKEKEKQQEEEKEEEQQRGGEQPRRKRQRAASGNQQTPRKKIIQESGNQKQPQPQINEPPGEEAPVAEEVGGGGTKLENSTDTEPQETDNGKATVSPKGGKKGASPAKKKKGGGGGKKGSTSITSSNLQPKVTRVESGPATRVIGSISRPFGSPWCNGRPMYWLGEHHSRP